MLLQFCPLHLSSASWETSWVWPGQELTAGSSPRVQEESHGVLDVGASLPGMPSPIPSKLASQLFAALEKTLGHKGVWSIRLVALASRGLGACGEKLSWAFFPNQWPTLYPALALASGQAPLSCQTRKERDEENGAWGKLTCYFYWKDWVWGQGGGREGRPMSLNQVTPTVNMKREVYTCSGPFSLP